MAIATVAAGAVVAPVNIAARLSEESVTVRDRAGEVRAGDLDLRAVKITRGAGSLTVTFTLAQGIRNNVIYSTALTAAGHQIQISGEAGGGCQLVLRVPILGLEERLRQGIDQRTCRNMTGPKRTVFRAAC
jgi:hypothetical protein